jgi:hypothetical protein
MIFWTTLEVNTAISCACIMTFKPLIQRVFPRLLSPSKGFREPQLPWITPINNNNITTISSTNANANSNPRHPFAADTGGTCLPCPSKPGNNLSVTSFRESGTRRSGNGSGSERVHPCHHQRAKDEDGLSQSRYYHSLLKPASPGGAGAGSSYGLGGELDLEAQCASTCSDISVMTANTTKTTTTAAAATTGTPAMVEPCSFHDCTGICGSCKEERQPQHGGGGGAAGECDDGVLSPTASLRAPPRAYLRLSIHVTRSVVVKKWPRSPSPGKARHRN